MAFTFKINHRLLNTFKNLLNVVILFIGQIALNRFCFFLLKKASSKIKQHLASAENSTFSIQNRKKYEQDLK